MKRTRKYKRELERKYGAFKEFIKIIRHYFPDFVDLMSYITDPRNQSYITYDQEEFIMLRILAYCVHSQSMKDMNRTFNHENVIKTSNILFGNELEEVPHGDTINDYLKEVDISQMRQMLYGMVRDLMKKKYFEGYKIMGKYHHVIIDGVNMFSYKDEKIKGSIKRVHDGQTTYHTMMLVAVIERDNVVIPLDFEPIENEGFVYNKQDCEQKASKRLIKRIKKNFKRLEICLSGDALYFNEPMISLIEDNYWKYIITYKEGCAPTVEDYYRILERNGDLNTKTEINEEDGETYRYDYYNGVEYHDMTVNMMKLKTKDSVFCYATNLHLTDNNIKRLVESGRKRWKIENKGFNDLKNKGYRMTHAYSYDENAVKGHFILLLMAHIIMQLMEQHERNEGIFETIHSTAQRIKEALRTQPLSAQDLRDIATPIHLSRLFP